MKQSEYKEIIKSDLTAMGFLLQNDLIIHHEGNFAIIIQLSRQPRVVIETSGCVGSYYIILEQVKKSYSETSAKELLKVMNLYIRKCKAFNETK